MDVRDVPGYPFNVPPPFPVSQLKALIPAPPSNNGLDSYRMIDARCVPQAYQLREPLVSIGCTWDPRARMWTMTGRDKAQHQLMVDNFQHKDGSLLRDYIAASQSIKLKDNSCCEMKNSGINEKMSAMNIRREGKSIITIGESDESDDDVSITVKVNKTDNKIDLLLIFSKEEDLMEKVLKNLDSKSLMRMELTCKLFRNFSIKKKNNIWKNLSTRKSKSDPHVEFEWKKKLAENSTSEEPTRIAYKKTCVQFERLGQNLREGSALLTECPQVRNIEHDMACTERFLSVRSNERIFVKDRLGDKELYIDIPDNYVIGIVNHTLLTVDHRLQLINLFKISLDGDEMTDISKVSSIGPIVDGIKALHLMGDFLAICANFGFKIELHKISVSHQKLCEVIIPIGCIVQPVNLVDWQSIDIDNGKMFASLRRVPFYSEFHLEKIEEKIIVAELDGKNTGFICDLLDSKDEFASLKASDGFLYVVTKSKIKVWNFVKRKLVMSKRIDMFDPRPWLTPSVRLNDNLLIVAVGKVLTAWDRKECEKEEGEENIRKYKGGSSKQLAFSRNILSGCGRSLLWKVELPSHHGDVSLESWKITLLPRYRDDRMMLLDFWN